MKTILQNIAKKLLLCIPQVKKLYEERNALIEERNGLIDQKNIIFEEKMSYYRNMNDLLYAVDLYDDILAFYRINLINENFNYSIKTNKEIAYDSLDHIIPWGTKNDNSKNIKFVYKIMKWLEYKDIRVLDIGCSGGGSVKQFSEFGAIAVGVEGSDYSKVHKRAEWGTIPNQLFTADATHDFTLFIDKKPMLFNLITAWEFIEHIETDDLPQVFKNIDKHLDKNGVCIMSVATVDDIIEGHNLHRTIQPYEWWLKKVEEFGFKHNPSMVDYFNPDCWIRWEENARGSFHLVLNRKQDTLPTLSN